MAASAAWVPEVEEIGRPTILSLVDARPSPAPSSCRYCLNLSPPTFQNDSETLLAKIFEYYRVLWLYEVHTFVLSRHEDGGVREAFTPDFFRPNEQFDPKKPDWSQGFFVEVTVMKQSLATRKHRKVRKARELFPEVQIKIFHRRDIERLAARYRVTLDCLARTEVDPSRASRRASKPRRPA